jgi:hypothetical protein
MKHETRFLPDLTNNKHHATIMQKFRILPFLLLLVSCSGKKKETTSYHGFSGMVTQTNSYCGGARPSEEILEEYNKPKPYAGKVLHVREGKNNASGGKVVLRIVTNDSGYFSGSLPPGSYCIVQEEQLKPLNISGIKGAKDKPLAVDSNCLDKWWSGSLATFQVPRNDTSGILINFHHPCFVSGDVPCIRYVGPMPP